MKTTIRSILTLALSVVTIAIFLQPVVHASSDRQRTIPDDCIATVGNNNFTCEDPIDESDDTTADTSVELSWTPPTTRTDGEPLDLSELEGYRVYVGTDSENLVPIVDLNDSSITTHSITDLTPGTYYLAVTAYDYDGLESGLSTIVSKQIL
jgi:hypothetical protein